MTGAFVYDAVRTPFGKAGGALSRVRPDDLAATVMRASVDRLELDPARIDDVLFGDANQAGEDNRNVARFGALLAGFPTSVPGATVNRLCGSAVEAVIQGSARDRSRRRRTGSRRRSRVDEPCTVRRGEVAPAMAGPGKPDDVEHVDRMADDESRASARRGPSRTASRRRSSRNCYRISREEQDAFALRSHRQAATAWADGLYDSEIVQVPGATLRRDEGIRDDAALAALGDLRALFAAPGTVTAGNSSSINDGASAILLGAEGALDVAPLARITGRGVAGNDPDVFGVAPVEAANRALARAGRTWADVDIVELNEAFAAQSLACLRLWPELDPARVNIHGGAIAIGHPLGASGGRIIGHAAHELRRRGGGIAVAAICIGVGQGLAVVLEA